MSFEKHYGKYMSYFLKLINPIKKLFISTKCKVHLFNNYHAIRLLKDYKYNNEFLFYKKYLYYLNQGSIWADQDFKSTNHFYNPYKDKGLYGHSNSLALVKDYYNIATHYYKDDMKISMFYLGACIHIIQDLTIPQHVNIRLFDNHRQFETYVKYTHTIVRDYQSIDPPILLDSPSSYVEYNSRVAVRIHEKYINVHPIKMRFHMIALTSLPLAQSSTAGCLILFYKHIKSNH